MTMRTLAQIAVLADKTSSADKKALAHVLLMAAHEEMAQVIDLSNAPNDSAIVKAYDAIYHADALVSELN